jgi:hypothetical protein
MAVVVEGGARNDENGENETADGEEKGHRLVKSRKRRIIARKEKEREGREGDKGGPELNEMLARVVVGAAAAADPALLDPSLTLSPPRYHNVNHPRKLAR